MSDEKEVDYEAMLIASAREAAEIARGIRPAARTEVRSDDPPNPDYGASQVRDSADRR